MSSIFDSARNLLKNLQGQATNVGHIITQDVQRSPIGQQVSNIGRVAQAVQTPKFQQQVIKPFQIQAPQQIQRAVSNFSPGRALINAIPGQQYTTQAMQNLHIAPPNIGQIGQIQAHQNQVATAMGGMNQNFNLTKPLAQNLPSTPQQKQQIASLQKEGVNNFVSGMLNPSNPQDLQKAAFYLRSKLTPESANVLKDFATLVETKGANANLGQTANNAAHIMADAFGKDAHYWTNQKMKNTVDLVLGKVGGMKNNAGLGLSLGNIREDTRTSSKIVPKDQIGTQPAQATEEQLAKQSSQLSNPLGLEANGSTNGIPGQNQKQLNSTTNPSEGIISQSTQDYINQMQKRQDIARGVEKGGLIQRGQNFLMDVKRKLVDSTAPIEDVLASAQKKGKFQVLPTKDVSPQIDRAIRSRELAGQFLKDNGMVDVIRQAPDLKALNQYLIAKHTAEVATKTGRNAVQDAQLVKELAPQYEPFAQKVVQYGQKLLDYATQTGLVSKETATMLKQKYPNYVPLNRIFTELEKEVIPEGAGVRGVASLSKQSVVQKLQGSERAIQNPIESLLTKTTDAFAQGERNQAGQMLASYEKLPGNPFQLRELKPGESAQNTISYLDGGVKKTFETTPEIAQAAKFLDKRQLGLIGNIFATPVRLARVGITGVNIPFVAANIAKDQVSAVINSNHALQTSIIGGGGQNFVKSLWAAVGHGKEYDNWIRNAGGGTSFDISRSEPNVSVAQIRAGRNLASNIKYTVTHPAQLLRAVEDVINRGEELTRLQQHVGTRQALLKQGRTLQDANILAAKASRENTVNFGRSGDWGKALNSVFLYMNAGIQGSRTLVRNLQTRPVQTAAKIGLTVMTPLAAVTAWNMSDPKRLQAYNDIRDYEKDGNLIIVPPNPTKDPNTGKWNVIKVPFSQEIAQLTIPVRKSIEALQGADGPSFMDVAGALLGSATSLNTQSPNALVGQFIPQAIKPPLESLLNKNLFTGQDIVPQYINGSASKDLPPELQVHPDTSGTARGIGRVLNTSPLKVEQFIKSTLGGVGSQAINASDTGLAAVGAIPSDQIGGQSIAEGITQRFALGSGGQQMDKIYNDSTKLQTINTQARKLFESGQKDQAVQLIRANKDLFLNANKINAFRSEVDTYNGYKNKIRAETRLTPEQKKKALQLIQQKLDSISAQYSQ